MINSRVSPLILFAAAAAALITAFLSSHALRLPLILIAVFFMGLGFGVLLKGSPQQTTRSDSASPRRGYGFSSALLRSTINEMREGLLVIDPDMRVVASNQAARHLFSNVGSSLESRRITEITRNPAIYEAFLDGVRGNERAGVRVETRDRDRKIFDLRVLPLRESSNGAINGALGVFFDVTRLERLEIIRQEFLSNVSHELRTPLTSIIALSETLEAGAIDDAENNRRFLSIIQKNAARMHRLIDDILELSAIEAGTVKLSHEVVPLRTLVDDVIASLSAAATSRRIEVRNMVSDNTQVFADPHRLMQMLTNLVDNAIKFNRDNGHVSIFYQSDERDRIIVTDSGEGIPSHHLDRLFERFYRVDRARSRELGGTGLGLAIVKHLAKLHGGEVTVKSELGAGTEFTIELPPQNDDAERLKSPPVQIM